MSATMAHQVLRSARKYVQLLQNTPAGLTELQKRFAGSHAENTNTFIREVRLCMTRACRISILSAVSRNSTGYCFSICPQPTKHVRDNSEEIPSIT